MGIFIFKGFNCFSYKQWIEEKKMTLIFNHTIKSMLINYHLKHIGSTTSYKELINFIIHDHICLTICFPTNVLHFRLHNISLKK